MITTDNHNDDGNADDNDYVEDIDRDNKNGSDLDNDDAS